MQSVADRFGIRLRPHAKSHKCPEVARLQESKGAVGICVQTLAEAEIMAASGCRDIFITNEIAEPSKIQRLVGIQERAKTSVAVDSLDNAEAIAKLAIGSGTTISVLLEIDIGMGRCGVPLGAPAVCLAKQVSKLKGLRFEGVMAFEGHLYRFRNKRIRELTARRLIGRLVNTAERIRKASVEVEVVSCGSTPTAEAVATVQGVTEIQPGNYVFNDLMQLRLGRVKLNECALRVLSTVLSTARRAHFVVDAGVKAFGSESVFPRPIDLRGAKAKALFEEHLIVAATDAKKPRAGEKVEFIPYEASVTVNMHDRIWLTKNSEIVGSWNVAGRSGKL